MAKMQIIELVNPKKVNIALVDGKKLAVFAIDEDKNPLFLVSEINPFVPQNNEKTDNLIAPALQYIEAHFNKDIKLTYLANLCDVSPSYFSRVFSATTGTSISSYVTAIRLEKAAVLLSTSLRPVVEIACEVGYVDCGYFYKLFRKRYLCTPVEYRNRHLSI